MDRINFSLSADQSVTPAGAFAASLAVVVLDINDNDVKPFREQFKLWAGYAQPFATKIGVGPEFKALAKRVMKGDDLYGDDDDVVDFGKAVKGGEGRAALNGDTRTSREMVKLIVACARCLAKDDEKAWQYLERNVSILENPRLTSVFLSDDDSAVEIDGVGASEAAKKMRAVVQKLTGNAVKDGYFINPLKARDYAEKNPAAAEEYKKLKKILDAEVKRLVFRYVRNKAAQMVSIDEVSKFLEKQGVMHNLPRGFTGGQIDENGNFYTAEGKPLASKPMGQVRMNPKYDPAQDNTYVLYVMGYGKSEDGKELGPGRVRTTTMLQSNKERRHSQVADFIANEAKIRGKWLKDLDRRGTKEQVMAALVEMMWATSARIGGKGNQSAGEPTYGMTTLQVQHVRIKGQKILFDYTGKKNSPQPATYNLGTTEGRKVKAIVERLIEDAEPTDLLFTFRHREILRHAINKYLKSIGCPMSAHGFRRVKGTQVAMELLRKSPFTAKKAKGEKITEAAVNKWFKEEMKKVGEVLHHRNGENVTGMTAVKSYISPSVVENFYEDLGLRRPSFVPKSKEDN